MNVGLSGAGAPRGPSMNPSGVAKLVARLGGMANILNAVLGFLLALAIWFVMQTSLGQNSFLSAADQSSLDWAFQLRDDQPLKHLGPTVLIDIDDRAWTAAIEQQAAALAYTPRDQLARALELARGASGGARPAAVILDADLSWRTPDEAAESRIDAILADWAADPDAPLLVLIREPAAGLDTPQAPARFRDPARAEIFAADIPRAPIVAATARATVDNDGRPERFSLFSCVAEGGRLRAMASPVLFAAAARRAPSAAAAVASVNAALEGATRYCRGEQTSPAVTLDAFSRGEIHSTQRTSFINYNVSVPLDAAATGRTQVARDLLLFPVDTAVQSVVPTGSVLPAVVVIGSSAALARDYFRTPLGEMSGSALIVNALRGFEAAGPLRNLPPALEIPLIGISVIAISAFFMLARSIRIRIIARRSAKLSGRISRSFARFLLNPVSVEIIVSVLVTFVGFAITFWALDHGYFASIAGPSFAAAFNEARQEFEELTAHVRADA
jgi:hypothetical protein